MKKHILIVGAISALLYGCASTEVKEEIKADKKSSEQRIAQATDNLHAPAPIILPTLKVPYLGRTSVATVNESELPQALRSTVKRSYRQKYAYDVEAFGRLITEETGLPVTVTPPPLAAGDQVRVVDLSPLPPMTTKELLDVVAPQYGVDWEWEDTVLRLSPTFTRFYDFDKSASRSAGKMTLGKSSQSQIGTNGANAGTSGNFESELKGTTENNADSWEDVGSSLRAIAGANAVVPNKSLSLFAVTCSKICHRQVKSFMATANVKVTQQVLFHVMEVSVATTRTGQSGVNWNVFYQNLGLGKQLLFSSPQSLVSQTAAGALGFRIIEPKDANSSLGAYVGSDAVFQALSSASTVVDTKPYDLMAINNEPTTLGSTDQQSYVQATTVVPTGTSGSPVFSQTPGYATFGQFIQVIPTVLSGGRVIVRFGLDDTKLKQITPGANQGDIDRILLGALNFNNQAIVRSGSTLVLSGFKRKNHKLEERGLIQGQQLGSEAGDTDITETIIMITPTITGS